MNNMQKRLEKRMNGLFTQLLMIMLMINRMIMRMIQFNKDKFLISSELEFLAVSRPPLTPTRQCLYKIFNNFLRTKPSPFLFCLDRLFLHFLP